MPILKRKSTAMEKEIYEQPQIVRKILEEYVKDSDITFNIPENITRINLIASGSSYHCARYCAELFGNIAQIEASATYSSEFLLKSEFAKSDNVLYIFITQSGETTDTNKALQKAKEFGLKTLCITNKENSPIWNSSDYKILCHAGEERSIAATKSLTSQLLCSTLLVLKFAKNKEIDIFDYLQELKFLPETINKALDLRKHVKSFANFLSKHKHVVMCADGSSYALAKEASLKIKETSYINTCSYILGEFMHGHSALLNNKKALLVYILNGDLSSTALKNLNKLKETYNPPICIIGNRINNVKSSYNLNIDCDMPIVKTFGLLVIIQLLALETALKLKRNVDKPKGLNKVVT